MSSDDDIPGLESVSGSEGLSSEEDEESDEDMCDVGVEEGDPHPKLWHEAGMWMMFEVPLQQNHIEVVHVYVLSPFLYGHAHQSDRWLKWCHQVGLLQSDIEFNLEAMSEREIAAVDIVLGAIKSLDPYLNHQHGRTQELARLLDLMERTEHQDSISVVVRTARRLKWFMKLVEEVRQFTEKFGGIPPECKNHFLEIGCLFVINQAVEHVSKVLKGKANFVGDFKQQCASHEESGKILKEEGEDYEEKGNYAQAIETYSTAIICCPYYYQLYINRANAYMEVKNYRASVADGLRAVNLKPEIPKTHICYIQALTAAGLDKRSLAAIDAYHERFPLQRDDLKRSLEQLRHRDRSKRGPTAKEQVLNDKMLATCKQASEAYLSDNLDEAVYYYEEAVSTSEQNEGWKTCWVFTECELFLVSLRFAYGLALMKKGNRTDAEKALHQFTIVTTDYSFLVFPPVHYGLAKCLVLLHNHSEALVHIKKGLELLPSYRPVPLTWPGMSLHMMEIMPYDIETKLQQLLQQCEPQQVADAVCRYSGCLQHHTTNDIIKGNTDYKGHVRLQCSEGCSISYHPTCWRKFKGDCVISSDKDYLSTLCPTPDCEGEVKGVYVHNDKGIAKIKFEAEVVKKTTPTPAPPTSLSLPKENKRSTNQVKPSKKKSSVDGDLPDVGGGKALSTPSPKEEAGSGLSQDAPELMKEDARRGESSLLVKNEKEQGNGRVEVGGKAKGKKKVQVKEKGKTSSEHWNDLFNLPEREGLLQDPDDESMSSKWEPNPSTPFQPPEHLKDMIDEFEMNEAPSIGLAPRLSASATSTSAEDENIDFFVS